MNRTGKNATKITKQILLIAIVGLMLLPYLQTRLLKIPVAPLVGVSDSLAEPLFSVGGFFDGTYQESRLNYAAKSAGFRPWLIRLKNQGDYSLFNCIASGGVVIGREGCLFLDSYLDNYCGIEFQGVRRIDYEVNRLALMSRELKKAKVGFLVILAPGKATFEQENIPGRYRKRSVTNYEYYSRRLASSGLDVIDMNRWFRQLKPRTPYPLFPARGVHWTSYAVGLAADSMVRYIETMRNIDLPELSFDRVTLSDSLRYSDNDAAELMNVFCTGKREPMPYPEFRYITEGKHKPDVVVIADSYWWGFITSGISYHVFGKARYWFYNKDIYEEEKKVGKVSEINVRQELERQEVVIMLVTEATWMLFPFGVTDAYLADYRPGTPADREAAIVLMMDKIRSDAGWYRSIGEKAQRNRVSVEAQLRMDAEYMVGLKETNKQQ